MPQIKFNSNFSYDPTSFWFSIWQSLWSCWLSEKQGVRVGVMLCDWWGTCEPFGDPGVAKLTSRLLFRLIWERIVFPWATSIPPPSSTSPSNTAPRLCRILTQKCGQLKAYRMGFNTGFKNAIVVANGSPTSTSLIFVYPYCAVTSIMQKMW